MATEYTPIRVPMTVAVDRQAIPLGVGVEIRAIDAKPYTGEYIVTPMVDEQTLETAQKFMTDNVTVKAIPYQTTSNLSGGYTATIGG